MNRSPYRATVTLSARRFYALVCGQIVSWVLLAILGTLLAIGYADLRSRTQAVCQPLRSGQALAPQTTSEAGEGFARTFGDAADQLGCRK